MHSTFLQSFSKKLLWNLISVVILFILLPFLINANVTTSLIIGLAVFLIISVIDFIVMYYQNQKNK